MSGVRPLFEACARGGARRALAIVLETEGSTYARRGGMALFGEDGTRLGWLSGGCLEPQIARRAQQAIAEGRLSWMEIDTRDDEDLLAGSALGCRGRLHLALLPLHLLPGSEALFAAWNGGGVALEFSVDADGAVGIRTAQADARWRLDHDACDWAADAPAWILRVPPPPELLVFGAGPESPLLLPLLRDLGWRTGLVERRERWRGLAAHADHHVDATPTAATNDARCEAALVMHHHFELDREALAALATTGTPYIGLLGPRRRRDDLFKVLAADARERLSARLRSPVGLPLGGHGPEAIALSIAAQLQAWRAERDDAA